MPATAVTVRPGQMGGIRHAVLVMAALAICAVTAALLRDRTDTQAPPRSGPNSRHRQNQA